LVDAVMGALELLPPAFAAYGRLPPDAAHQLRTPVAVLDLRLQRARLDEHVDWPTIEAEMGQLSRLLDQLLDMARKDHAVRTASPERISVNLSRIVREVAAQVLPIAEEADRSITVDAPDTVTVLGHPDDLRDMVRNLLDNALVHGEGTVHVMIRRYTNGAGEEIVLEVEDEGDGVSAELREAVFDRFRKADANSPGAGLGLAITRQVARDHGGDARFAPDPHSRITVILPAETIRSV
jgi:signal transduction histidine kinase